MYELKNFGAADELKIENGKLKVDDDVSNDGKWEAEKVNGKEHPNIFNSQLSIFNSKKRYGFTLDEDTEIISADVNLSPLAGSKIASADVNLSPLRGKYPPEAGERGLMKRGFTLAEVLITLVVIGVVAAITIPVLHSNTQGKEWNAAKQKARAGLGEAFKLASVNDDLPEISAKEYIETVLPKYLKIAKTCDTAEQCGFAKTLKTPEGKAVDRDTVLKSWKTIMVDNAATGGYNAPPDYNGTVYENAGYFQTLDGFSVAMFYNPLCAASSYDAALNENYSRETPSVNDSNVSVGNAYPSTCFNAVYDMNGAKGPNRAGDDIGFVGSFNLGIYAQSAAVLPVAGKNNPRTGNVNYTTAAPGRDFETYTKYCATLNGSDYILPSVDEASLIALNWKLMIEPEGYMWTRTRVSGDNRHMVHSDGFRYGSWHPGKTGRARCVRADKLM